MRSSPASRRMSGCDTTAREANARDFRVLFLSDGTATNDADPKGAQAATLEMIGSLFGQVLTVDEVFEKMGDIRG